jgi:hypothetical protein
MLRDNSVIALKNNSSSITDYKREEEDKKDTDNIFKALIIDVESELNIREPDNAAIYFTTFRDFTLSKTSSVSAELVNRAFSHLLTAEDLAEINNSNIDLFTYSLSTSGSYYTLSVFIDIIINTGVLRKSIADYK